MQKAVIAGVNNNQEEKLFEYEMEELKNLCLACEIDVCDIVTQNLNFINTKTYMGSGKLEEIKIAIANKDANVVVFNDELSPSQIMELEKLLEVTIYDRTYVILEIFKRRAQTREAMLQVEIASLKYMLPRLVGLRKGLSRQRGTGGNGAHGRGQGETQLEIDRRNIGDRIALLNKQLLDLKNQRSQQRKIRKKNNIPVVSLVGYTNSGKSSTMNAIMNYSSNKKKEVFEKDMLFATLQTSTRNISLSSNREFLLTDTVGFVSKLPHTLVEAFKSTLEEITESNLIVHVVDCTNPHFEEQIEITNEVLKEIGVENIPTIFAFNKIDRHEDYFYIPPQYENCVRISALNDTNITNLLQEIEKELFKYHTLEVYEFTYDNAKYINLLKETSEVLSINYNEKIEITAKVSPYISNLLEEYKKKNVN